MDHDNHEETLSALHSRGQQLYCRKQYEAALQCFTKAINQAINRGVGVPSAVLDNRAATHTKLGNLRAALKDGREMIQQDKASSLGYLRTGKIVQLLGNNEMALDLYAMGRRKVPTSDPDFVLLQGQYEKLVRLLGPPRSIDPLQILPLELVEMTIKHLAFRRIVGLLRVSKSWQQLLISMPSLWRNLDLLTAKKPVSLRAIREFIKRSNGTTTRVMLDRFGSNATKISHYVAASCKGLEDLRITAGLVGGSIFEAAPCASNLKTLIVSISCQVSCDTVSKLLGRSPNLERAEFYSVGEAQSREGLWGKDMPRLRTLILDTPRSMTRPLLDIDDLLLRIIGITTLSVKGWFVPRSLPGPSLDLSNLHQLQHLDVSFLDAPLPPRLPSTVQTLSMANNSGHPPMQGVSFPDYDLPQMLDLSLAGWFELSLNDLQVCLIRNKGKLKRLDIGGCIALSSANFKELITHGYFEGVEDLVLKLCNLDDEIAMLIASNLPRLKNLNLAYTKVTGVGVKALVIGLKGKLEHLDLDGCNFTNIDAIEFARAMGVKVGFAFPDSLSGGRRIKQL